MSVCLKTCAQIKPLKALFIAVGGLDVLFAVKWYLFLLLGGGWKGIGRRKISFSGICQQEIFVLGADVF